MRVCREYWARKQYAGRAYGPVLGVESSLEQRLSCGDLLFRLYVIQLVNTQVSMWYAYAPLIQNIVDLLNRNWNMTLRHSFQEGNACADCLTKIGANCMQKWVEFESPPSELLSHLLTDANGGEFPRL